MKNSLNFHLKMKIDEIYHGPTQLKLWSQQKILQGFQTNQKFQNFPEEFIATFLKLAFIELN
jgi:hypothetical protein